MIVVECYGEEYLYPEAGTSFRVTETEYGAGRLTIVGPDGDVVAVHSSWMSIHSGDPIKRRTVRDGFIAAHAAASRVSEKGS